LVRSCPLRQASLFFAKIAQRQLANRVPKENILLNQQFTKGKFIVANIV